MFRFRKLNIRGEENSIFNLSSHSKHIVRIINGQGKITISGETYKIENNSYIYIPCDSVVRFELSKKNDKDFTVFLCVLNKYTNKGYWKDICDLLNAKTEVCALNLDNRMFLNDILNRQLESYYIKSNSFISKSSHSLMSSQVSKLISKELGYNWTIEEVSEKLYVSKSTLKRRLKDEGTSLSGVLLNARMLRARKLLVNSDMTISSISDNTGFASVTYFCKKFKDTFGVPATKLRGNYWDIK